MRCFRFPTALAVATLSAAWSLAADLKVTGADKVPAHKLVRLAVEGAADGSAVIWDVAPEESADLEETAGGLVFTGPPGRYTVKAREVRLEGGKLRTRTARLVVVIGDAPPAPPGPAPPGPKPPGPTPPPEPVTSFRVLFVWESGTPLTAAQNSVVNGLATAKFLDAKTSPTDGGRGWRLYDKDRPTANDTATWNALWAAVKPKVTAVPCVAVEVNGKVDIIPLGATTADMLATFNTYLGGK